MIREFRDFIARGNVMDLAVAVAIGAAFGKIVDSLVKDVLMPPVGLVLGRVDFSNLFISLNGDDYASLAEAQAAGAPTINYGLFLNALVTFLIVAFAIFMLIKQVNRMRGPADLPSANEKQCPHCLLPVPLLAHRCAHCTSELPAA